MQSSLKYIQRFNSYGGDTIYEGQTNRDINGQIYNYGKNNMSPPKGINLAQSFSFFSAYSSHVLISELIFLPFFFKMSFVSLHSSIFNSIDMLVIQTAMKEHMEGLRRTNPWLRVPASDVCTKLITIKKLLNYYVVH